MDLADEHAGPSSVGHAGHSLTQGVCILAPFRAGISDLKRFRDNRKPDADRNGEGSPFWPNVGRHNYEPPGKRTKLRSIDAKLGFPAKPIDNTSSARNNSTTR